ncbi:MAG: hypothetical protein APF76_10805 [Desulfitibacter sp. BRH_c19]|nr:MAG: hypothetical protein APF76_10805 [Desulfitibacter sp. BRH_c19]
MSLEKEQLKKEIIKYGQLLIEKGLVIGTGGNISVRVNKELMMITPSGMAYDKLIPEDIVIVDMKGNIVEGDRKPSIEVNMHRSILRARKDINAVVHTHSVYASAIAITRQDLPPVTDAMAIVFGGAVKTAEYARTGTEDLAVQIVEALGDTAAALLANHGAVGVGKSLDEALGICELLEASAKIYIYSNVIGKPVVLSKQLIQKEREDMAVRYGQK